MPAAKPSTSRLSSQPAVPRFSRQAPVLASVGTGPLADARPRDTKPRDTKPRRVILVIDDDPAMRGWSRLACEAVPGRDWVTVRYQAGRGVRPLAQSLPSLLKPLDGSWPLIVGCGGGAVVALRVALEHGDFLGGLLLVGAVSAASHPASHSPTSRFSPANPYDAGPGAGLAPVEADGFGRDGPPVSGISQWLSGVGEIWSRWRAGDAARRMAISNELGELAPRLRNIHAPVVLVDTAPMATFLEGCLTGSRMLTAVTVSGGMPTPQRNECDVRGALDALIAAAERAGR